MGDHLWLHHVLCTSVAIRTQWSGPSPTGSCTLLLLNPLAPPSGRISIRHGWPAGIAVVAHPNPSGSPCSHGVGRGPIPSQVGLLPPAYVPVRREARPHPSSEGFLPQGCYPPVTVRVTFLELGSYGPLSLVLQSPGNPVGLHTTELVLLQVYRVPCSLRSAVPLRLIRRLIARELHSAGRFGRRSPGCLWRHPYWASCPGGALSAPTPLLYGHSSQPTASCLR